ncbi:hypothetical protein Ddc_18002 [Ditylenchus destructor]|nr:hypothetical protein Ddc_18002 [Ditylenchus destructor]
MFHLDRALLRSNVLLQLADFDGDVIVWIWGCVSTLASTDIPFGWVQMIFSFGRFSAGADELDSSVADLPSDRR